MTEKKSSVSILVPCYNEGKTLRKSILSWLGQTSPADEIIIVNDRSTDNTLAILEEFKDRVTVITNEKNTGNKSFAQEIGMKYIKTDIFIATDGDTMMDQYFVERVRRAFENPEVSAFAGYVKSLKYNWLTACREIDYIIGQDLYKSAQSNINFLMVIPGCAGAFRTEIFRKYINFDHDTLAEDLDFTFKLNKKNFKIFYDPEAIVFTQDPNKLRSYINQMRRWYSGNWQNLMKHIGIVKNPIRAFEISLVYIEGLLFYFLMFMVPVFNIRSFLHLIVSCAMLGMTFGIYAAIKRKRLDLLINSPAYVFVSYINAYIFLEQFVKEVILKKKNLVWFHPERRAVT